MRHRRLIGSAVILVVAFLVLWPIWLTWKQFRQQSLNQRLIGALSINNVTKAVALLDQGADPNIDFSTANQRTFWEMLLDLVRSRKKKQVSGPPQPLLFNQIGFGVMTDFDRHTLELREHTEIVQALLEHGANQKW